MTVTVLASPGSVDAGDEALLRMRDLTWLQVANGRERELADFIDLLDLASDAEGWFMIKSDTINQSVRSPMMNLEIVYQMRNGG